MGKKYVIVYIHTAILFVLTGLKRKGKDTSDIIEKLMKFDEKAEQRAEEATKKWMEMEEQREERRLKREEEREDRMMSMFQSVMTQMAQAISPAMNFPPLGYSSGGFPSYSSSAHPPYGHHYYSNAADTQHDATTSTMEPPSD